VAGSYFLDGFFLRSKNFIEKDSPKQKERLSDYVGARRITVERLGRYLERAKGEKIMERPLLFPPLGTFSYKGRLCNLSIADSL
jgi:hypothetical protein